MGENLGPEPPIYIHILGNKLLVSFKPCEYTETKIKSVSGAKKNSAFARWEVPLANYENLTRVFDNLVLSEGVTSRLKEEADLKAKIENLKKLPWYEIEDYIPKLPLYTHQKKAFELHRWLKGSANFSEVGSGKCRLGTDLCIINGLQASSETIWDNFAENIIPDPLEPEAFWATPTTKLLIPSLEKHNIVDKKITKIYRQKINETIRRITLTDGSQLSITKSHKLLKTDNWSNDLKVDDIVCVPRYLPHQNKIVDLDLASLFGWMVGDGCDSDTATNTHTFTQEADIDRHNFINILKSIKNKYVPNLNIREKFTKDRVPAVQVCNKTFRKLCEDHGYLWGKVSAFKRVPTSIMQGNKEVVKNFLRSYFDAEGSIISNTLVEITSASENLIKDINILLRRFGIWLRTRKKRSRATNGLNIWRDYWVGTMGSYSSRIFAKEIGFSVEEKQKLLLNILSIKVNTNVEWVPSLHVLQNLITHIPQIPKRFIHTNNNKLLIDQNTTRDTLPIVIQNLENLLNGEKIKHLNFKLTVVGSGHNSNRIQNYINIINNLTHPEKNLIKDTIQNLQNLINQEVHYVEIKKIEEINYEGWVYDFEVEDTHNYVSENVLCHNTASAICAIHWHLLMKHTENCLVVCPLSIIKNWQDEIARFSNLTTIAILGSKEQRIKKLEEKRDVYLINYDYISSIKEELLNKQFRMLVLDEAHRIKNPSAEQSKTSYELGDNAEYRIALTGSPILNTPMDAFGIMRFVDPSVFGESFFAFRNRYFVNTAGQNSLFPMFFPKHGAEEKISDLLVSKSIRYLKADCLDLPPAVTLPDRVVPLSDEQDKAYKQMQENFMIELAGMKTIKLTHFLSMMMKLNQITSGWFKVPNSDEIVSFKKNPKFEELKTIVEEELLGKPLIIWVYYRADIQLIYNYFSKCQKCKESILRVYEDSCSCGAPILHRPSLVFGGVKDRDAQIAWFRLTEEERKAERQKLVEAGTPNKEINKSLGEILANGQEMRQTNIFIGQISAASEGLNLQRATYSVYFSRDYSLKNHIQSLGRNHRGGQKQTVTYINLVCARQSGEDTMDMHILSKLKKKEDMSKKINKDDLRSLFGDSKVNKEKLEQMLLVEVLENEQTSTESSPVSPVDAPSQEAPESPEKLFD